ncbi:hypothetical protein ABW19_dt0208529 [Dactylella cylindrospora]|nr:hypothetical protein ABW19_dt0208529 [Dactylella cylindrospora]
MELFRRISGSSTSSTDDGAFKRSRSLTTLRRKSSKDNSKAVKKTLKEPLKEYNMQQTQTYTSAPQSPLIRKDSYPENPDIVDEGLSLASRPTRPASERMYSHGNDSISGNEDDNDSPLVTALSPRRESTLSIPFTVPRMANSRRISEHIDPMSPGSRNGSLSLASIPRLMSLRRKSEAVKVYEEEEEFSDEKEQPIEKQEPKSENIERIVPKVSVLPDVPLINSASSSFSDRHYKNNNRASIVSFVTSNSSIPSPTTVSASSSPNNRKILPYIPDDEVISFDLLPPGQDPIDPQTKLGAAHIEELSQKLYSKEHLRMITSNPKLLSGFSRFLETHRPTASMGILTYYLNATKAIKAINYANAIAASLGPSPAPDRSWIDMENEYVSPVNKVLERKAADAFKVLVEQELPRYVAWVYSEIVTYNVQRKITGSELRYMDESANELAEVFCLTDPQRPDNPIIFASEEFHRVTQYPISYVSGRNCRFLQGPKTQQHSIQRMREAVRQGHEITECFLNYKRDGTPFLNLCMVAPLCDAKGQVRYFVGAQVDVTSLVKSYIGLDGFRRLMSKQRKQSEVLEADLDLDLVRPKNEEFRQLCELFSAEEMEKVKEKGGHLHKDHKLPDPIESLEEPQVDPFELDYPTETFVEPSDAEDETDQPKKKVNKRAVNFWTSSLKGVYRNYILVRPSPSLRILFASPSMRTPGILQSPLMSKIGGSDRVREELEIALSNSRGITVKVRWLSKLDEQNPKYAGRERWLHCTPLFSSTGAVGVWMIIIVDDDSNPETLSKHEYDMADLNLGMSLEGRPGSGYALSYRLSTEVHGFAGPACLRRDAPVIKDPEEWKNENCRNHPDLIPFEECSPEEIGS